nr:MAG TPA: hypothetical protein [Caudoviricetes sp.]
MEMLTSPHNQSPATFEPGLPVLARGPCRRVPDSYHGQPQLAPCTAPQSISPA